MEVRAGCTKCELTRAVCQTHIVQIVPGKHFEILAMVAKGTQKYAGQPVPASAALRDANGTEHIRSATEGKGGFFPPKVVEQGAIVRVQDAQASREEDRTSILNHIVGSADPTAEPPVEHARYDQMNRTVHGLFRGAAMFSHAMHGSVALLQQLLADATADEINYRSPRGETPAYIAAQENHVECLRLLADKGADLNQAAKDGSTPAFIAAHENHVDCLWLLAD
jgi:hypothetical protein